MKQGSHRVLVAPLFLGLLTSTGPSFAQYGSSTNGFDTSEIDKMKETCLTAEQQQYYKDRMRSSQSSQSGSISYSPVSLGAGMQNSESNQSRDINSGSSSNLSNCDGVIRSYFQWKQAQLYADAMKTNGLANADAIKSTGLANADAMKSTGLANADANKTVGLASAAAMQSVGLANSKAQIYTGIAGAAGGVLGSLFTSGNQKAAVKAQADAEVEKVKIAAQVELEKARMQYDLIKGQGGGASYPQPYQQRQYAQPGPPEAFAYQQQYAQQQYPPQMSRQDTYGQPYTSQHVSQQPYIQPYPQQNYQRAALSTPYAASKPSSQSSNPMSGLRKYIASLRLVEDPLCNPGSVIIMSSASPRVCAFPSSIMPSGTYVFDGTRLVKY